MLPSPSPDSSAAPELGFCQGNHATKGFPRRAWTATLSGGVVKRPAARIPNLIREWGS